MSERQLSWQPGFSLSRKPAKRPAPRRNKQQRFEFVVEYPSQAPLAPHAPRVPRARRAQSVTVLTHAASLSHSSREDSIMVDIHKAYVHSEAVEDDGPPTEPSLRIVNEKSSIRGEATPNLTTHDGTIGCSLNSHSSEDQSTLWRSPEPTTDERHVAGPVPHTTAFPVWTDITSPIFTSQTSTMEYSSLTQRFQPILNRCMLTCCTHSFFQLD